MPDKKLLHKARKLSRVFREGEPAPFLSSAAKEALLSNAGASASNGSLGGASAETETSTRPSSINASSTEQLRRKASRLSRQSMENFPPPSSRQSLDSSAHGSVRPPSIKRSLSLWTRQPAADEGDDEGAKDFQDRYLSNFGTMSERQRALNVKRARKMTQLFGQEPPAELMQIQDARESQDVDASRDSMAFSGLFASTSSPLRDRANSVSSVAEPVDGETPAPVENGTENDHTAFQDRRRRAAKLSRFFGVGFADIASLPEAPSPSTRMEVDVKISNKRFWGFNERPKDTDMQDAIHKLRELKAS